MTFVLVGQYCYSTPRSVVFLASTSGGLLQWEGPRAAVVALLDGSLLTGVYAVCSFQASVPVSVPLASQWVLGHGQVGSIVQARKELKERVVAVESLS